MKKILISLIFISLFTSACSVYHINYEEVTSNYYPPKKSPDEVQYLDEVTRPHEIIGFVTVNTERRQDMDEIMLEIKKKAALLGGDAVTNLQINASGQWEKIHPQKLLRNAYVRANFTATVVGFTD